MDVRCEKCGTEYELEDSKVTAKGVKVKCTQCGHLFRVVRQPNIPPLVIQGKEPGKISVTSEGARSPSGGGAAVPSAAVGAGAVASSPGKIGGGTAKLGSLAVADTLAVGAAKPTPGFVPPATGPAATGSATPAPAAAAAQTASAEPAALAQSGAQAAPVVPGAPAAAPAGEPEAKPSDTPTGAKKVESRRWYIRKPSGEIFQFRELTTLQQWIVEEKVSRDDEISRTGRIWEKLGVIEELSPFFSVVDQARRAREAQAETLMDPGRHPAPAEPAMDEDAPTGRRGEGPLAPAAGTAGTSGPWELGRAAPAGDEPSEMGDSRSADPAAAQDQTAAWEADGLRVGASVREPTAEVALDDEMLAVRRPGATAVKVGAVAVVGGLIGLAVFVVWSKWEKIIDMLSGDRDRTSDFYNRGRALFRQDTDESFKKALEQFKLVMGAKGSAEARASRAEVLALWSLYLSEDARHLQKKAAELGAPGSAPGAEGKPGPPELDAIRKEMDGLRQRSRSLAIRAYHDAQLASKKKSSALTHRAQAEALLALGKPLSDVQLHLEKSLGYSGNDPETLFVKALFLVKQSKFGDAKQVLGQAITINRQQSSKILYRAHYLLALVLARKGDVGGARAELQTILGTNPTHARAKRFLNELTSAPVPRPRPMVVAARAEPDGGVAAAEPRDSRARPESGSGSSEGDQMTGDYYTLVRKGDRFSENGRLGDALKAYQKALVQRPGGVEALIGLAYCYLDRRQTGMALSTFRRALRVRPGYGEALIGLAQTYKRMGNLPKALEFYKKYVDHNPAGRKSGLARRNIQELQDKVKASRPAPPAVPPTPPARPPVVEPPPTRPADTPRPVPRPPDMGAPSRPAPDRPRPAGMEPPRPAPSAPRPSDMEARPSGG